MQLVTEIVTHSHLLEEGCFDFFAKNDTGFRFTPTSESSFTLSFDTQRFVSLGSKDELFHSHLSVSCYLIALNIVSLGYFVWRDAPSLHPIYMAVDAASPELAEQVALLQQESLQYFEERKMFSTADVEKSVLVYGGLLKDSDQGSRTEYLKGLLHIGASHLDITFHRDAFANFYRCVEAFITRRILGKTRLSSEVKEIQQALQSIGAGEELAGYFKEVYTLRSSQVAHAQNEQRDLTFDDVLKAKAFADLVMYKWYRKQAEEWRASRQV